MKCLHNVQQPASGYDLVNATLLEGPTDNFTPGNQLGGKLFIQATHFSHLIDDDFLLNAAAGKLLLHGNGKAFQEGIVNDLSSNEATVICALALGVGCGNDVEARSWMHHLAGLLVQIWLAFHDGLHAHQLVAASIAFVDEQDGTAAHGHQYWTFAVYNVAINQGIATDEIVFVGFNGHIDTDAFQFKIGTNLLHHGGLTIA